MDFVGKSLSKNLQNFGVFQGVVQSYDSTTGFYRVLFEDGNFEEIDSDEVSRLISNSSNSGSDGNGGKLVGRKPKRRRRNESPDPGKIDCNSVVDDCTSDDKLVIEPQLGQNLENTNADVNLNVSDCVAGDENYRQHILNDNSVVESQLCPNLENNADVNANFNVNDCGDGDVKLDGGLDLNRGFEIDEAVENSVVGGIDLNVSADNSEFDENRVGLGKVGSLGEGVDGGELGERKKERGFDLNLGFDDEGVNEVSVDVEVCAGSGEELRNGIIGEVETNNLDSTANDEQSERDVSEVVTPIPIKNGNSGRRKRKKGEKTTETVLRRSARRAKVVASAEITASSEKVEDGVNDLSVSGITEEITDVLEVKHVARHLEMAVEPEVPPSKIDLPPSSASLNLEGIPAVDLFMVYSCLRSFSTLLYLSPFELEEFVVALKSKVSNLLIDCIHVSILQTLRKHLEVLSNEGCESASTCLRNLNWVLLDEITWPVFMMEYLLIHGSCLKTGFNLNQLNLLFDGGYYNQPENVKIELLRCLCDDVVEVDAIRLELNRRRIMESNTNVDRKLSSEASGDFEDVEEVADGNSDECCLCKMDGNLICCDGCPAAYHSKCVGIVSNHLPEGDWYCPECAISRQSFGGKPRKLFRGAEPLGFDPYGRLFFSCFDYLLVSDSYDTDSSFSYYHKDDLNTVIQLLKSSSITYGSIIRGISQNWAVLTVARQLENDIESDNCSLKHEEVSLKTSKEPDEVVLPANKVLKNSHRPPAKRISAAKRKKKNSVCMQFEERNLKVIEDDFQEPYGHIYVNNYKFGLLAASVVEELLRKPSDKGRVDVLKSEEEIIAIQSKFIMTKSTKFCWPTIEQLNRERQKEKCGWCYCCRFSVGDRECLFNSKNRSCIPETLRADINVVLLERSKKGHLVDIICVLLCMEERLRGLLLGPWLSPQYSELWRKLVLEASDVYSLKQPLLMLESSLHPLALSADWSKHVDSVATMGSASHFVTKSRGNSKNGISKKKGRYLDSETKSPAAGSGLSLFWWRGGKTSRSLFNWKVMPRSIALKAARKAGYMKISDILYSDSTENTKRNKYVAWRAAVEGSRSTEQLALQVRDLDLFIRWNDIENTHPCFLLDKETTKSIRLFKKAIIRRKCVDGPIVKYLLDFGKRRNIPEVVIKQGLKLEDTDSERKKYWLNESYVPLYLIKIFEERRIVRKSGKTKSSVVSKNGMKTRKLPEQKGFDYLFSRAEVADNNQCGHCNKHVPISEAVSCKLCNGFFHKRHVMKFSKGSTSGCTYTCYKCRAGKQVKNDSTRGKKKIGKLLQAKKVKIARKAMSKAKLKKDGKTMHQFQRMSLRNVKKVNYQEPGNLKISRNTNVAADVARRRSAREAKCVTLKPDVLVGAMKRKRNVNAALKKTPKTLSCKNKRTHVFHSFWINGLRMSRKPKDERVMNFKRKRLCVAFQSSGGISDQPRCSLCLEQEFKPTLVYIACDICEVWFHGEAFGLNRRNIKSLIGFKCHVCREISAPICPFAGKLRANVATSIQAFGEAQHAQVLPGIQVGKDASEDYHSSEDSPGLPGLTQQIAETSGFEMQNGSEASAELIANSSGSNQRPICR